MEETSPQIAEDEEEEEELSVEELGNAAMWWQGWTESFSLDPPGDVPLEETKAYLRETLQRFENGVRGLNLHVKNLKSNRVGAFLIEDVTIPQNLNIAKSFLEQNVEPSYPLCENDAEESEIVNKSIQSGPFISIVTCAKLTDSGLLKIAREKAEKLYGLCLVYAPRITDVSIREFACRSNLLALCIRDCDRITDEGMCEMFRQSPNLQYLDISQPERVSDRCLATVGQSCPNLSTLRLVGTEFTGDGLRQFFENRGGRCLRSILLYSEHRSQPKLTEVDVLKHLPRGQVVSVDLHLGRDRRRNKRSRSSVSSSSSWSEDDVSILRALVRKEVGMIRWDVVTRKLMELTGLNRTKNVVIQKYRFLCGNNNTTSGSTSKKKMKRRKRSRRRSRTPEVLPWQLQGPHIGCLVILRVFESHDVLGKVTHYCPPNDRDHALWRVRFGDESDEVDDLDFDELNAALEKYNTNRSCLGKLYKLAMSKKLKQGRVLVTVRPRCEIVREDDTSSSSSALLQDKNIGIQSKAESKALMRRIYSKIDKDTTRDEMLNIIEMPQSGWFIERVRRTASGIQTRDRVDRYFHHKTLFGKPVRFRSITEVKRNILSIQNQFVKTKLVVCFHVNQERDLEDGTQDKISRVLTTEQYLCEVEQNDDDEFVSNIKRLVDEIESSKEINEEEEEEEEEHEESEDEVDKKKKMALSATIMTNHHRTDNERQRPSIKYWILMSNILKANKRKMRVKEITSFVSRYHPYFAKLNPTNLGCALRAVLNKRSDMFAKHVCGKHFVYSLVGEEYENDDDDDDDDSEKEEEEEQQSSSTQQQIGAKYVGAIKEVMISLDKRALSVREICESLCKMYPSFRNRGTKYLNSSIRKVLELRDDLFERLEGSNVRGVTYSLRRDMMDADVVCQKCDSGTQTDSNVIVICGEEKEKNHGCNRGWHVKCLSPILTKIPKGDWFCKLCAKRGTEGLPLPTSIRGRYRTNTPGYKMIRPLRLDDDVYVWWPKEKSWFTGSIVAMKGDEVTIEYMDGDVQRHAINELNSEGWRYCFDDIVD